MGFQECPAEKEKTIQGIIHLQDKEVLGGPPQLIPVCLAIENLDLTVVE